MSRLESLSENQTPTVTLVGASTRAMAWSATRAGERPYCLDLFTDTDLLDLAGVTARRLVGWPPLELDALLPEGIPWAYTGGLENFPDLLGRLAAKAPLWGVTGRGLRISRMPGSWGRILKNLGLHVPACRVQPPEGQEPDWLLKPYRGAGGRGVGPWPNGARVNPLRYFAQKKVPGQCSSAVFAVSCREAELLGVTEQWVGQDWLNANGLTYCGSLGPLAVTGAQRKQLGAIGQALVSMDLRGVVGVDLMLEGDAVWVIEINPRWPASLEILERALGFSAWRWHRWGCGVDDKRPEPTGQTGWVAAKAILFAPADVVFPKDWPREDGVWADVPAPGEAIPKGSPVLTTLALAATGGFCRRLIIERVNLALRLLGHPRISD